MADIVIGTCRYGTSGRVSHFRLDLRHPDRSAILSKVIYIFRLKPIPPISDTGERPWIRHISGRCVRLRADAHDMTKSRRGPTGSSFAPNGDGTPEVLVSSQRPFDPLRRDGHLKNGMEPIPFRTSGVRRFHSLTLRPSVFRQKSRERPADATCGTRF